jgi:hypothetical protein
MTIPPMPWRFWKAPGTSSPPQRYLDLTLNVSEKEIAKKAHSIWKEIIADSKKVERGLIKDPWARIMDEYQFMNSWREKARRAFPGLLVGGGLFGVYWIYDQFMRDFSEGNNNINK